MGLCSVSMTVTGIDSGLTTTLDALVDTGATHSMVPADVLANLGVTPVWRSRIRMANESVIDLPRGNRGGGSPGPKSHGARTLWIRWQPPDFGRHHSGDPGTGR